MAVLMFFLCCQGLSNNKIFFGLTTRQTLIKPLFTNMNSMLFRNYFRTFCNSFHDVLLYVRLDHSTQFQNILLEKFKIRIYIGHVRIQNQLHGQGQLYFLNFGYHGKSCILLTYSNQARQYKSLVRIGLNGTISCVLPVFLNRAYYCTGFL